MATTPIIWSMADSIIRTTATATITVRYRPQPERTACGYA